MSGDVLYSDVKFVKKGKGPSSSNQEDVTYSEVRRATPKPTNVNSPQDDDVTYSMVTIAPAQRKAEEREEEATYAEVQTGSQPNSPPGKSNTKKRVAIGLLIFLLVLAIILIVIAWHIPEWTNALQTASNSTETAITPTTTPTSTNTKKTTTSGATSCPLKLPCDTGWKLNGTKCYHFSTTKSSWNQSRDECKEKRGYLVKIDSREEQRFLFYEGRELIKTNDNEDKFWIGLTDAVIEDQWRWVDDTPLNQR
uniref:C-type lectin domain-containing protein n=1 Tax=Neogobius melanostomus TaxID=47308 RepID=A0A8C6SWN4_9GOBI